MMNQDIDILIKQYTTGQMTSGDIKRLRRLVANSNNKELALMFEQLWSGYEDKVNVNVPSFDEVTERLFKLERESQRKTWTRFLMKPLGTAAAVLIPVIFVFYVTVRENRDLKKFITQKTVVNVKSGEKADIRLPDGTKVFLNAGTTLSYANDFGLHERAVKLNGEALMDVTSDPSRPFVVETENVFVEVLGTQFNICAYWGSGFCETTLLEGSLKLTTRNKISHNVTISPENKATYRKSSDSFSIVSTSTYFETAWVRGELVLRSATFDQIMRKLELRYGVTIEMIGNKPNNNNLFTGSFNEDNVHNVMKILQNHYDFTYDNRDGKIYVKFKK